MSQTSVEEQSAAMNGQKYALGPSRTLSYAAEARIEFGRYCSLGTDKDLQCIAPAAATDITNVKAGRGVALQSHAAENLQDGLEPGYEIKKPVSILGEGEVYVEVEEAVTPLSDVFVRFADTAGGTGGTNTKGIFRSEADTATAAELPNARWIRGSELMDGKLIAVLQLT